jgi:hypothetical protein
MVHPVFSFELPRAQLKPLHLIDGNPIVVVVRGFMPFPKSTTVETLPKLLGEKRPGRLGFIR